MAAKILLISLLLLTACIEPVKTSESIEDLSSRVTPYCIYGIKYWGMYLHDQAGILVPAFNSITGRMQTC